MENWCLKACTRFRWVKNNYVYQPDKTTGESSGYSFEKAQQPPDRDSCELERGTWVQNEISLKNRQNTKEKNEVFVLMLLNAHVCPKAGD